MILFYHPGFCFHPRDQELLLAMSFLFRSVRFCFLFLLTSEGQVEGDLRPIALLDLKWPCRVLLRRVFQQASGSLSCPSSSFSGSGSGLPPSSHPIISHSSPYPYWHEMYHQQLLFLGCLLQNGQMKEDLIAMLTALSYCS